MRGQGNAAGDVPRNGAGRHRLHLGTGLHERQGARVLRHHRDVRGLPELFREQLLLREESWFFLLYCQERAVRPCLHLRHAEGWQQHLLCRRQRSIVVCLLPPGNRFHVPSREAGAHVWGHWTGQSRGADHHYAAQRHGSRLPALAPVLQAFPPERREGRAGHRSYHGVQWKACLPDICHGHRRGRQAIVESGSQALHAKAEDRAALLRFRSGREIHDP